MKTVRVALCGLLLLFVTFGRLPFSFAQEAQTSGGDTARQEQNAPANAAPEPKQSSGENNDELKHSSSVKLLARITGLSVDGAYWLAVILNFVIVAALIVWISKKNLPAVFRDRTGTIQKSLQEARRASEDANQRLAQIESRLSKLDDEIAQMRATSEKEAAAEEERIKASAEEEARHIIDSAEQEIAAAAKAARRDLTSYAADLAVSLAAKQIRVDANTDQALLRRFAQQLSNGAKQG
jgi:F-type H+-transporting ATPase subunit b